MAPLCPQHPCCARQCLRLPRVSRSQPRQTPPARQERGSGRPRSFLPALWSWILRETAAAQPRSSHPCVCHSTVRRTRRGLTAGPAPAADSAFLHFERNPLPPAKDTTLQQDRKHTRHFLCTQVSRTGHRSRRELSSHPCTRAWRHLHVTVAIQSPGWGPLGLRARGHPGRQLSTRIPGREAWR